MNPLPIGGRLRGSHELPLGPPAVPAVDPEERAHRGQTQGSRSPMPPVPPVISSVLLPSVCCRSLCHLGALLLLESVNNLRLTSACSGGLRALGVGGSRPLSFAARTNHCVSGASRSTARCEATESSRNPPPPCGAGWVCRASSSGGNGQTTRYLALPCSDRLDYGVQEAARTLVPIPQEVRRSMNDQWDRLVVGGRAAGLSAAPTLGRARLRTLDGLPQPGGCGMLRLGAGWGMAWAVWRLTTRN